MWHNMKNMFASNIIHTADNSIHINVQSCACGAVDVIVPGLTLPPGPPAVQTASPRSIQGAPGYLGGCIVGWPAVRNRDSSETSPSAP